MIGKRLFEANRLALKQYKKYPTGTLALGRFRKTKVFCSDYCCGNPRKHFGELTPQEKKAPTIKEWDF